MTEYETSPLSWIVKPKGEPVYSEMATTITIDDEAAGPFLVIKQEGRTNHFSISPEEWPAIRAAIDAAINAISEPDDPATDDEQT
jgi:hypothetical protein